MTDILIVDEAPLTCEMLGEIFNRRRYTFCTAHNAEDALTMLQEEPYRLVITDLRLPGMDGLTLLNEIKRAYPHTEVIILTAFGTVESAVQAVKEGAYDYLPKPFQHERLETLVENVLERHHLMEETKQPRRLLPDRFHLNGFISKDERIHEIFKVIRSIADSDVTVLISGETGTGKELIAQAIHHNSSRRKKPFVKVNCSAIPEGLLESELFGHEKGAFTHALNRRIGKFEHANSGTLFLDEVGDVPPTIQVKLLRVIEQKEFERIGSNRTISVDVRVIAATNHDLSDALKNGRLRKDFYHRLSVILISLPPLRERKGDIPLLIDHFLQKYRKTEATPLSFSLEAIQILVDYMWPGNVRELQNVVERLALLVKGPIVLPNHLPQNLFNEKPPQETGNNAELKPLECVEREYILKVLEECHWNKSRAAKILGIDRSTLARKLHVDAMDHSDRLSQSNHGIVS
jgi:DNA-binding NtrC family response regulator